MISKLFNFIPNKLHSIAVEPKNKVACDIEYYESDNELNDTYYNSDEYGENETDGSKTKDETTKYDEKYADEILNSKKYTFEMSTLNTNLYEIPDYTILKKINIIPFLVNTECKIPFILIGLQLIEKKLDFITIDLSEFNETTQIDYIYMNELSIDYLNTLLKSLYLVFDVVYKGYIINENEMCLYYEIKTNNINSVLLTQSNEIWFSSLYEIINTNTVCNIPINKKVINNICESNQLYVLKSLNGNYFEVPCIYYTGTYSKKLEFEALFGVSKSASNELYGNVYHFTDYKNAIKNGGWSQSGKEEYKNGSLITDKKSNLYKKGGIIRYAIFLENNFTQIINMQDKNWINKYDSIFGIDPVLFDNSIYNGTLVGVKQYNSFIALSFHYIDKAKIESKWESDKNYEII